jgi:hypothetical protein
VLSSDQSATQKQIGRQGQIASTIPRERTMLLLYNSAR